MIFLAFTDSKRLESAKKKRADIQVVPTPNPALISTLSRPRSSLRWFEGPNHAHANSPENTEQHPFGPNRLTHKRQKKILGVFEAAGEAIWSRVESCTPQHSTALFVLCCVLCCIWKLNFECCEKLCNYCTALWKLLWKSAVFWQKSSKIGLFRRENF